MSERAQCMLAGVVFWTIVFAMLVLSTGCDYVNPVPGYGNIERIQTLNYRGESILHPAPYNGPQVQNTGGAL